VAALYQVRMALLDGNERLRCFSASVSPGDQFFFDCYVFEVARQPFQALHTR
jgi:hypothetical protein